LGRLILADEYKVDIPVIHSIIVANEYTLYLHTSSTLDCPNKNAMNALRSMSGEKIRKDEDEDEGIEVYRSIFKSSGLIVN